MTSAVLALWSPRRYRCCSRPSLQPGLPANNTTTIQPTYEEVQDQNLTDVRNVHLVASTHLPHSLFHTACGAGGPRLLMFCARTTHQGSEHGSRDDHGNQVIKDLQGLNTRHLVIGILQDE